MKPRQSSRRALFVTVMLVLAACGSDVEPANEDLQVIATTTILGDVVENIVGDDATVEVLLPLGADPHDYQVSARQATAVQEADLVIANGLLLEDALSDVLGNAASDGANILSVGEQLRPLPFGGQDDGTLDPHVWMDPTRMAEAASVIAAELAAVDDTVDWAARAETYAAELLALDEEISALLAVVPASHRKLVTNHDSLGYFADRYDFEIVGTVIPGGATLANPSSAEMAALVENIRRAGVAAIFAETTEAATLAEAVAAEVGEDIPVVVLYTGSLGEPGSGADTLIAMLRTDAERIAAALSG